MPTRAPLISLIRERGPLTVAAFMELALYDPEFGYYARSAQRSGRAGDFFTSVDVGPLFGDLLAVEIAEMARLLSPADPFDLVEAGAGNGRLSRDILEALRRTHADVYERTRLHLVDASAAARRAQTATLDSVAERLRSSSDVLPATFDLLIANELFDAMPVHQLVMRGAGLREVYVEASGETLITIDGPVSTARLNEHLDQLKVTLEPGWRCEVSLAAIDWMTSAARGLARGFAILIDYGHQARELYSVTHSNGTLTTYAHHRAAGPEAPDSSAPWLSNPGEQDLTAHVDWTSLSAAAEAQGCTVLGLMDQMYFLMALGSDRFETLSLKERLALKTLIMPGGLGTTMKVLILGKHVGTPRLTACSGPARLT